MSDYDDDTTVGLWVLGIGAAVILLPAIGFGYHACATTDEATLGNVDQRVRTHNFEQSVAFREGTRRDFDELRLAYAKAKTAEERSTIRSVIRHRAEGCPPELVPPEIHDLLNQPEAP